MVRDLASRIRELHSNPLTPIDPSKTFPIERVPSLSRWAKSHLMNQFCEYLTGAMFGGNIWSDRLGNGIHAGARNGGIASAFTVANECAQRMFAPRLVPTNQHMRLIDTNMGYLMDAQINKPDTEGRVLIYRPVIRNVSDMDLDGEGLLRLLAERAGYAIALPLSFVLALHSSRDAKLVYRYEGETPNTCVKLSTLSRLLKDPLSVALDLGFDKERYSFERYVVGGVNINGHEVSEFPLLWADDLDYSGWLEGISGRAKSKLLNFVDTVASVAPSHKEELVPVTEAVVLNLTGDYSGTLSEKKRTILVSLAHETIVASIFGGRRNNRDLEGIRPDVYDQDGSAYEVKSICTSGRLMITDDQLIKYRNFQFDSPSFKVYYAIYKYSISGDDTREGILKGGVSGTECLIMIPLSMIIALHQHPIQVFSPSESESSGVVFRGEQNIFEGYTSLTNPGFRKILSNPEGVISEIGLNPLDYVVRRVTSPSLSLEGNGVKRFPILMIGDKDHSSWVRNFMEEERTAREDVDEVPQYADLEYAELDEYAA